MLIPNYQIIWLFSALFRPSFCFLSIPFQCNRAAVQNCDVICSFVIIFLRTGMSGWWRCQENSVRCWTEAIGRIWREVWSTEGPERPVGSRLGTPRGRWQTRFTEGLRQGIRRKIRSPARSRRQIGSGLGPPREPRKAWVTEGLCQRVRWKIRCAGRPCG